jgi:hypothetical protein
MHSALKVPLSDFSTLLPRAFKRQVAPSFGCAALPVQGYLAQYEYTAACQLDPSQFEKLCKVFAIQLDSREKHILFNTLDLSGNGLLSWGELSVDLFNTTYGAMEFYINRNRQLKEEFDGGLSKIQWVDYEKFNFYDHKDENQWY